MQMEIDAVSKGLDDGNDTRLECFPRRSLKIEQKRPDRAAAKLSQELALELEEHPQHLGNNEDHLAVRNVQVERLNMLGGFSSLKVGIIVKGKGSVMVDDFVYKVLD